MIGKTTRAQAVGGLDDLIDRQIFLSGALDEGVKQFAKAKADAMPYLEIADTIDAATEIKTQAEAKAAELAALAQARAEGLDAREQALSLKETDIAARLATLERNEANFASVREAFDRKAQSHYEVWHAQEQTAIEQNAKASVALESERKALEAARYTLNTQKEGFANEVNARDQEHRVRMEALAAAEASLASRIADFEARVAERQTQLDGLERDLAAKIETLELEREAVSSSA